MAETPWVVLATLLAMFLAVSLVLLWFVCRRWDEVRSLYSQPRSKTALSILKFVSGVIAVWAKSDTSSDPRVTTITTYLGLASLASFEIASNLAEGQMSKSLSSDTDGTQFLKDQIYTKTRLLRALIELVNHKKERANAEIRRRKADPRFNQIASARLGFAAEAHMLTIVQQFGVFLKDQSPKTDEGVAQNFRIALYIQHDGQLKPMVSWDVARRSEVGLISYQKFPERFNVSCVEDPSCVVRCLRDGKILIISNFEEEKLAHYHTSQKAYLKSLVAFPILHFASEDGPESAVLQVDTDIAGHFRKEDEATIKVYFEQFAARLDLEATIHDLLRAPQIPQPEKAGNEKAILRRREEEKRLRRG